MQGTQFSLLYAPDLFCLSFYLISPVVYSTVDYNLLLFCRRAKPAENSTNSYCIWYIDRRFQSINGIRMATAHCLPQYKYPAPQKKKFRIAATAGDLRNFLPQCRHMTAPSLMSSAQNGHFIICASKKSTDLVSLLPKHPQSIILSSCMAFQQDLSSYVVIWPSCKVRPEISELHQCRRWWPLKRILPGSPLLSAAWVACRLFCVGPVQHQTALHLSYCWECRFLLCHHL